jgi:protein-L-isoaspartate(D-aspartate) O-methyltransferase
MKTTIIIIVVVFACIVILAGSLILSSCNAKEEKTIKQDDSKADRYEQQREAMVARQIEDRGVKDARVLAAMRKVPRHLFVPGRERSYAYTDGPLSIGKGQTISQPYIVAFMTELMKLKGGEKVLEIGTGSGYQAAVLAEIVDRVYTIEIVPELAETAGAILDSLGYKNVEVRCGDGYKGWPEKAPFDAVIVTAAPDHIPEPLKEQLKVGGRLVIPVGSWFQELQVVIRTEKGYRTEKSLPVRFVPMTGEAEDK